MSPPKNAVIAGAGLVGSLWALYLLRYGLEVDVYERRSDLRKLGFEGGRSINLALSHRGLKSLERVGLHEQALKMSIPMYGRRIHFKDGTAAYQAYGKENEAIYSISRGQLNHMLMNAAEAGGARFYFDAACTDAGLVMEGERKAPMRDREAGKAWIRLEGLHEPKYVEAPLIFGADGAFSAVRTAMMRTERYRYRQDYEEHGYKELSIKAGPGTTWQMEKNVLHIWPRKSFMLIALPNLDGSFTCTLFLGYQGNPGFNQLTSPKKVLAFFAEEFPDALDLMPHLGDEFFAHPTGSLVTIRSSPWTAGGCLGLIGDAAHAIVPFYGQGMNAGFEDCLVLDRLYAAHGGSWNRILPAFEQSRVPDAEAIADLALQNFVEMRDKVGDLRFLFRKKVEQALAKAYPEQYVPQYSLVSFTLTPYSQALDIGRQREALLDQWADRVFAETKGTEIPEPDLEDSRVQDIKKALLKTGL